jgi:hypothetical protein
MSEILSNIVLQPINSTFVAETNAINVNPEAIQLNIFTAGSPGAGQSSNGELLFNNNNNIDGLPNAIVTGNTLRFTNLANLKINGGTNSYFLQTDGTGNLTWAVYPGNISGNSAPGGANTQIQFNDGGNNFGGNAGFTFDKTTGDVNIPGNITVVGNINGNLVPNYANFAGTAFSVAGGNVVGPVSNAAYADNAGVANSANYANFAGTVVNASQPNITSVGILTDLRISNTKIHLGNNAGNTSQGSQSVAIGDNAGAVNQLDFSVAVGTTAGSNAQGSESVAVGKLAGRNLQGNLAVAIGSEAGRENQGDNSIAIGWLAGNISQGANSIAIGSGAGASSQAVNSIIINATGSNLNQTTANTFTVKPIRNANTTVALFYNTTTGEITYDTPYSNSALTAGTVTTNAQPNITSVGTLTSLNVSGTITAPNITANTGVFTGNGSGLSQLVAGNITGQVGNALIAGTVYTNAQPNITSVGNLADLRINNAKIHLGSNAGVTTQGANSIAIGISAGFNNQGANAVAIGRLAGNTNQGEDTTAVGNCAGQTSQGYGSTAIGVFAGISNQGSQSVAVGIQSGQTSQGSFATAVGPYSGSSSQGSYGVSIGYLSNGTGNKAIAIGSEASTAGNNSVAIGALANASQNNSIVLNATNANLVSAQANSLFVKPIRDVTGVGGFSVALYYNPTTGEIGYK